jgi:hypothetical protein
MNVKSIEFVNLALCELDECSGLTKTATVLRMKASMTVLNHVDSPRPHYGIKGLEGRYLLIHSVTSVVQYGVKASELTYQFSQEAGVFLRSDPHKRTTAFVASAPRVYVYPDDFRAWAEIGPPHVE